MTALHGLPIIIDTRRNTGSLYGPGPAAPTAITLLLLGLSPHAAFGQLSQISTPLFTDETPLALLIEGPFRTLSRERYERNELAGLVRFTAGDGAEVVLDVQIRTRGNSRMDICTYPPLRLNFRRSQVAGTMFAGQDHIKLVTLCKNTAAHRDYLALEYQTYRIDNALSDISYRVRWADIEYVQTDVRRPSSETMPGFLIEEEAALAKRTGLETWNVERLSLDMLDPTTTALLALFHFMIVNTDWAGTDGPPGGRCCHNGDVLRTATGQAVLIPYDFDQAGLIAADYSSPAQPLPTSSVRQRLHRGYCRFNAGLDAAVNRSYSARTEIESILSEAHTRTDTKNHAPRYVESFYEIINDREERLERVELACRGPTA